MIFGAKNYPEDPRNDYARVISDTLEVIQIDTRKYSNIVKSTQLSTSYKKVDFLARYVPKLRQISRNQVEDFEVYFQKEAVTRGYFLQKIEE